VRELVLADTGPLVALFDRADAHHEWAKAMFETFRDPLATAEPVIAETLFLLRDLPRSQRAFLEFWRSGDLHASFRAETEKEALIRLMVKYADHPMSIADACLVRMSELHVKCRVWTLDSHFTTYRRLGRQIIPRLSVFS
jgi:predicted nucleic acid-binding protein